MTTLITDEQERQVHRNYVFVSADDEHRRRLVPLHRLHDEWNRGFFGGRLRTPHVGLGLPPARSLAVCRATTEYGGRVQITLHRDIAFGHDPQWLVRPWPAEGVWSATRKLVHVVWEFKAAP